ncbi:MAG: beta-lactamase family protein [bacterium]|nr:beta-lactamase family protein [bacterium]
MKKTLLLFLSIFIIATFTHAHITQNDYDTLVKDLQATLTELPKAIGFPGVTAAVILPDNRCISLAGGLADMEENIPMKPEHRIFLGSIGKTYLSPIILQLMDAGKLKLDDKVSRFLGKEKWFAKIPNHADLTIDMLLTHTGGIPEYVSDKFFAVLMKNRDKIWKPEELLAFIHNAKPVHPAGKGWSYSDSDYILLGMIIEKITGNTFYEELTERILKPHGFSDTEPSDKKKPAGICALYTSDNKPPFSIPAKTVIKGECVINPQWEWTGGGLITTTSDMAKYLKALMEGKIISPKLVALMKQARDEKTGQPAKSGYGFGLEVMDSPHGTLYGHRGTMIGCRSIVQYVPKYGFAIALQINADHHYEKLDKKVTRFDYIAPLKARVIEFLNKASD